MDEQNTNIRPTKKQQELLEFIEEFIKQHDYSPSYREIMAGCNYTSVATVALHVNNLIERGHLVKREHSARSLEVVRAPILDTPSPAKTDEKHINWLVEKIDAVFLGIEQKDVVTEEDVQTMNSLVETLEVLELKEVAQRYRDKKDTLIA